MASDTVEIPSFTTPGRTYAVRMLAGRAIGCSCEGRRFRPVVPCSHMRSADAPAEIARLTALAQAAINRRLGYAAPTALLGVSRTAEGGFLLRLNSGGNQIAVKAALWREGYAVSPGEEANSVYIDFW
jgi:hypothetical protein